MRKYAGILLILFLTSLNAGYFRLEYKVFLEKSETLLGVPHDFKVAEDNKLYIPDPRRANIKIYDARTGKLLKIFGRRGEGPGEFDYPMCIEIYNDKLIVFDIKRLRVFIFRKSELELESHFFKTAGGFIQNMVYRNDKLITSSTYVDPANPWKSWTGAIHDMKGKVLKYLLKSPYTRRDFKNILTDGYVDVDERGNIYLIRCLSPEVFVFDKAGKLKRKIKCEDPAFKAPVEFEKLERALQTTNFVKIEKLFELWHKSFSWIAGIGAGRGKVYVFIREFNGKTKGWNVRYHVLDREGKCYGTSFLLRKAWRQEDKLLIKPEISRSSVYVLSYSDEGSVLEKYSLQ